jgi:hypothetical protein
LGTFKLVEDIMAKKKLKTVKESLLDQQVTLRDAAEFLMSIPEISEAYTQADVELALDDRGWLVGGKKMAGELDPLSRTVQVNKCRYYWLRDPLARQAVRLWVDYAIGSTGMTVKCEDQAVQDKINKWMKSRKNRKLLNKTGQRRLAMRQLVDGELFFALFTDGSLRTFDCLQINDIISDPDDEDTTLAYKRVTANNKTFYYRDWAVDDAALKKAVDPVTKKPITNFEKNVVMYHAPFDAFEKRGTGLFGACVNWSREHRRFMEARVAITQALATWAHKMTVKGGQAHLNRAKAALESTFAATGTQAGTERNPQPAPGATWLQNQGIDLAPTSRATGAGDARNDGDQLKLMVSAGTGIMLHYFGDPSTGNLATSTAMELPMLKMFAAYQEMWRDIWRDLFSIVLDEDPDEEGAIIDIDFPPILADDLQKLGAFLTSASTMFPELKVPQVLQMMLTSLGINNIEEVMEQIEAKREEIDQQRSDLAAQGIMSGMDGKPIVTNNPQSSGQNNPTSDQTESYAQLAEALKLVASKL